MVTVPEEPTIAPAEEQVCESDTVLADIAEERDWNKCQMFALAGFPWIHATVVYRRSTSTTTKRHSSYFPYTSGWET